MDDSLEMKVKTPGKNQSQISMKSSKKKNILEITKEID